MGFDRMTQRCGICKSSERPVVAIRRINGRYHAVCSVCLDIVTEAQQKLKNRKITKEEYLRGLT